MTFIRTTESSYGVEKSTVADQLKNYNNFMFAQNKFVLCSRHYPLMIFGLPMIQRRISDEKWNN